MKKNDLSNKLTFIDITQKKLFLMLNCMIALMLLCVTVLASENSRANITSGIEAKLIAVRGKVTSANGDVLAGVNIKVQGTNISVNTDASGNYSLTNVPETATLLVTYLGYQSKEVPVNNQTTINIVLTADVTTLEEVVVVGYGTVQRKDLTGSVSSVSAAKIEDLAVQRVDEALMGKLAGVQVKAVSGEPGAPPTIKIRGGASITAGGGPLYVVDGFPVDNLSSLNPNDIESLDVLKDASATAIYGSRGANGVVIVNTKRGAAGAAKLTYNMYFGYQQAQKFPYMQTAMEEAEHYFVGIRNVNLDNSNDVTGPVSGWKVAVPITIRQLMAGQPLTEPGTTMNFADPRDYIFRTAPMEQFQVAASGGSDNVKYAISAEYTNQDGIMLNTNFKRFSSRINLDAHLSKKLDLKMNINPSYSSRYNVGGSTGGDDVGSVNEVLSYASQIPPYYSIFDANGGYQPFGNGLDAVVSSFNPVALAMEAVRNQKGTGVLGNMNATYSFTPALKANIQVGINLNSNKGYGFRPNLPSFQDALATGTDNANFGTNWLQESSLTYSKTFGKHTISVLGLFSTQKNSSYNDNFNSNQYPNNLIPFLSGTAGLISGGTAGISEWSLVSYLGRVNYNYKNRYYVTASYRADGSSRFGANNKFGYFPSAALAWRASDEPFLKGLTWMSNLKVRLSYGETGNNNISNYGSYATVSTSKYPLGGVAVAGYAPSALANPDLTWETQKSFNGGVDIGLIKNRVSLSVDYFKSSNYDLLLNVNVPTTLGFGSTLQNIGQVDNKGIEFVVTTVNFKNKFKWNTDFNISTAKNKVIKLGPSGDPILSGSNITQIGSPIGMFYGWIAEGIVQSAAQLATVPKFVSGVLSTHVGDVWFRDLSGPAGKPDGVIDATYDKGIMGSPYPDVTYGITNSFSYKGINLDIGMQGTSGSQVLQSDRGQMTNDRARFRQLSIMNGYFKSEAEPGNGWAPRPSDTPTGNWRGSSNTTFLDTGSFLRVNSITLGYKLPVTITRKLKVSSARIYMTSTNPFTFTDNISWNPDVSRGNNTLQPGTQTFDYPLARSVSMGLNIGF